MEDEKAIHFAGTPGKASEKHLEFEFGIEEVEEVDRT